MNSARVEFEGGERAVISRNALPKFRIRLFCEATPYQNADEPGAGRASGLPGVKARSSDGRGRSRAELEAFGQMIEARVNKLDRHAFVERYLVVKTARRSAR